MNVKICGVTKEADAAAIAEAGADMIGLNFWPRSPRHISLPRAIDIAAAARACRPDIDIVGVFVNQSIIEMGHIAERVPLDYVQMHGDEPDQTVEQLETIKTITLATEDDIEKVRASPADVVLIDSSTVERGGSGKVANWSLAHLATSATKKRVILAGGLTPNNVIAAISEVAPWAVDVASGVEHAPGVKDMVRVREFIARAKGQGL